MRILVTYFSRTGATESVAREIASLLGADIEAVQDVSSKRSGPLGYLRSGRQALANKVVDIKPMGRQCADYDLVVIGTPVWAGRMSSPVKSFIAAHGNGIRSAAIFCTMGSRGGESTLAGMREELACPVIADAAYRAKEVRDGNLGALVGPFVSAITSGTESAVE